MTMNAPSMKTVTLPEPGYPMLTRIISNPLLKDQSEIVWAIGEDHPLAAGMKIVRMFVEQGSVEIYFVSADGKAAARNRIPLSSVRLIEEAMPLNVFIEELAAAEDDGEDDPEDDPNEPTEAPSPPTQS